MKVETKKASYVYDFADDILFAKPLEREYDSSTQMGDFIFDLDKKNRIIGFEILEASKVFSIPKIVILKMRKMLIKIIVGKKLIKASIFVESFFRGGIRSGNLNLIRERPQEINQSELKLAIKT